MKTGERKRRTDSSSDLTEKLDKRIDTLESRLTDFMGTVIERLDSQGKLPKVKDPDAQIAAMKAAARDGEPVTRHRTVDLRHPNDAQSGFKPNDGIVLDKSSSKYQVYQFDDKGEPVKKIFEYRCQACPTTEPYTYGRPDKKVCTKCGETMLKAFTGNYEPGVPAYGVVTSYMYTSRKGGRKYKVYFEKFGSKDKTGCEGLLESEMVLCQR